MCPSHRVHHGWPLPALCQCQHHHWASVAFCSVLRGGGGRGLFGRTRGIDALMGHETDLIQLFVYPRVKAEMTPVVFASSPI